MRNKKIFILFFLTCIIFTEVNGQKLSIQETEDFINVSLRSFESNRAYGYWKIKVIRYGNIQQISGTQILIYDIKDIETIKYICRDGEHLVQLTCKGNSGCIRNEEPSLNTFENWNYIMISIITKSEAEKLVNAFLYLKSIVPNSPFDKK